MYDVSKLASLPISSSPYFRFVVLFFLRIYLHSGRRKCCALTAGKTGNKAEIEEGRASGREEPAEGKQREGKREGAKNGLPVQMR